MAGEPGNRATGAMTGGTGRPVLASYGFIIPEGNDDAKEMRLSVRRLVAILAVILMVGAAILVYWQYIRPRTINEIFQDFDSGQLTFRHYKDGDTVVVSGTITDILEVNTTYGSNKVFMLDGSKADYFKVNKGIIVDGRSNYHKGDQFTTTIHFRQYRYNNDTVVGAEELFAPLPWASLEQGRVIAAVSVVGAGLFLVPAMKGTNTEYTVYSSIARPDGGYPLDSFNLSLRKGSHFGIEDAHELADYYMVFGEFDRMDVLGIPSANGLVEFQDNGNRGKLDDGDKIILHLPFTKDKKTFASYLLDVRGMDMCIFNHLVVMGNRGILEYSMDKPNFLLEMESYQPSGTGGESIIRIARSLNNLSIPAENYHYHWRVFNFSTGQDYRTFEPPLKMTGGVMDEPSIRYNDVNHDGILDVEDVFIINDTFWLAQNDLRIDYGKDSEYGEDIAGEIRWTDGLGTVDQRTSNITLGSLQLSPGAFTVSVTGIIGCLGVPLSYFWLRAVLIENGTEVANNTVREGSLSGSGDLALNFTDTAQKGVFNVGDYFTVTGKDGGDYTFVLRWNMRRYSLHLNP
jgi:hypothetical protein